MRQAIIQGKRKCVQRCMRVGVSGDRCRGREGVGKSVKLLLGEINILFFMFIYLFIPSLGFLCNVMGMDILCWRIFGWGRLGFRFYLYPFMFYTLCLLSLFFVNSSEKGVCLDF